MMLIGLRLLGEATLGSVASRTDGPGPVVGGSGASGERCEGI